MRAASRPSTRAGPFPFVRFVLFVVKYAFTRSFPLNAAAAVTSVRRSPSHLSQEAKPFHQKTQNCKNDSCAGHQPPLSHFDTFVIFCSKPLRIQNQCFLVSSGSTDGITKCASQTSTAQPPRPAESRRVTGIVGRATQRPLSHS
jgi:hypothetical protein